MKDKIYEWEIIKKGKRSDTKWNTAWNIFSWIRNFVINNLNIVLWWLFIALGLYILRERILWLILLILWIFFVIWLF